MADNVPDFVFQTSHAMNDVEHHAFVQHCLEEAKSRGGTYFRVSEHEERANLVLVECWKVEPEIKGDPAWQARDS